MGCYRRTSCYFIDGMSHVDHITLLNEPNLWTLCKECHQLKTVEQNSKNEVAPDVTLDVSLESTAPE